MSVNSSSCCNASLLPPPLSSSNSYIVLYKCLISAVGSFGLTVYTISCVLLLLPLCILILYLGRQQWWQWFSGTTTNHSDLFTFHMVVMEMINIFGCIFSCCGVHTHVPQMTMMGIYLVSINLSGQFFFHILTCVERYLAVVHPVTYLSLRNGRGIRIRNITVGCVWLLCFVSTASTTITSSVVMTVFFFLILGFTLFVISFCSLSVLCVLTRSGPADGVGGRRQIDQSKLRAFYTIMAIMGVLVLRFGGNILASAIYTSPSMREPEKCALSLSVIWFTLPSSLVLPLLFLHRAGKLPCCKKNTESG